MDILNFIYWIRNRRVISEAPAGSLVPIGVKDPRRDDKYLTCAIPVENLGGGTGTTTGKYRLSQFPDTVIPETDWVESTVGKAIDELTFPQSYFYDTLEDGAIVYVYYCQSKLENGIYIYEAYELDRTSPINGWWIAYRQDPTNPERFEKVGEVKMTQQFWDNWYDYTAKDSGENVVKFVYANSPSNNANLIESYITKLTWTGSALVAEDIFLDFGGATVLSLYNDLTGLGIVSGTWDHQSPENILDDDYYGMAMGTEKGWYWYRDTNGSAEWTLVGFNILTGETKWVDLIAGLASVTNFSAALDLARSPLFWFNHPDGITVTLDDQRICNNGDNYDGVTALWSPYWNDPTTCIYVTLRDPFTALRACQNGDISSNIRNSYWDNKAWYFITTNIRAFRDLTWVCQKYNVDTKETTYYTIPYITPIPQYGTDAGSSNLYMWANNNGMYINVYPEDNTASWGIVNSHYMKHADSILYNLHVDFTYPTHAYGDKISNINTMASYNIDRLGVAISTYKDIIF